MKDANFLIGRVTDGTATVQDEFGSGSASHQPDIELGGSDDVFDVTGSETGDTSEIALFIPLDSGDTNDRQLVEGDTYKVLLAYGSNDDLTAKHSFRGSVSVEL